jgi:predicted unusual protein kinase regulating ubiquinone biosynthesis (AarF/ABC1/UbiB family)
MDQESSLKTFSRMAQTAFYGSSSALKMATSSFLGTDPNHTHHAAWLKATLGNLKGPVMKAAQFLATVPGALPPEYAHAFLDLQSNAPSMGEGFVKRRMRGELGPVWEENFANFSLTPSFAASLGQVHQARLRDGQVVACKLQYPGMESIIEGDVKQLGLLLKGYGIFGGALDTSEIFEEISEKLKEELDYTGEAAHQTRFAHIFKEYSDITVPKVIPEISTHRLISMEWVEGKSLMNMRDAPDLVRDHLGKTLFHSWYIPLYHHGLLHGDPHPGNYQANKEGGINLLDFGCVREFEPEFIQGTLSMYRALRDGNRDLLMHAYTLWGFQNLSMDAAEVMSTWAKLLFEPLLDDRVRVIQESITGWDVASKVHTELKKIGGIKPPRTFVFMDRAAVGIGSVLFHLQAKQNWHRLFEEMIEGVG